MFKIKILKGGNADSYYVHLNEVDGYYTKEEEPPGRWHGRGAADLKISGMVRESQFKELMNGRNGERQLVQNAGREGRVKGFDCVIAPPKSVSVGWALANQQDRAAIDRAFSRARDRVIEKMEATAITRSGRGGLNKSEGARLIIGGFRHDTNRANEPSLHFHLVVMNAAVRDDGKTSTPDFSRVLRNQRDIGAEFRRELARELRHEGFSTREVLAEDEKGKRYQSFELRDVPADLVAAFSNRSDEIKKIAKEQGVDRRIVNLRTRQKKEPIDRSRLEAAWRQIARDTGLTRDGKISIKGTGIGEHQPIPHINQQATLQAGSRVAVGTAARGASVLLAALKSKARPGQQIDGMERQIERKYESDAI
jgi:conjugative relaxase-like TrwC/TraI family protein